MSLILVVDDDRDTANALKRLLERRGHQTMAAYSGREALQRLEDLKTHWPRLILLDIRMPDVDGFEVLRTVRSHPDLRDVPVVMFSAEYACETRKEARRLGANEYLVKGAVDWGDLITTLQGQLSS